MDALLSLPVLSYLVLPSFGMYGTSLNLLFFYITWSTLILSHSAVKVEVIGTLVIRILFYLAPSLLFLVFDSILPSLAAPLKIQGSSALPTGTNGSRRRRRSSNTSTKPTWYLVLGVALVNIILGIALQAGMAMIFKRAFKLKSALKVTTTLPFPWAIAKDVAKGYAVREILQYLTHRYILHNPSSPFAGGHRSFHHSVTAPHSFVAHYDHPLAWVMWRFIPTYVPPMLFRFHLLTYFVFLAFVSSEESLTFSGYKTLPSIILGGIARRQDLHLQSGGQGNFAPWGLMDWICGTSLGGDIGEDVVEELEKHDVPERVNATVDGVRSNAMERVRRKKPRA